MKRASHEPAGGRGGRSDRQSSNSALSVQLPVELLDAVAERVLERLSEGVLERLAVRQSAENGADGWLRGAHAIADYIGAPRSRVYALHSAGRLPCVVKDGSALLARRSDLDLWVRSGGGKRP
jgi:hypothetical protein